MEALLMCGGRGTRLGGVVEKPLVDVAGRTMIGRVLDALETSRVERVHAVVSADAPATHRWLLDRVSTGSGRSLEIIETSGDGYVADIQAAVSEVPTPALSVCADLPLLTGTIVDRVVTSGSKAALSVFVPVATKRRLGVSIDTSMAIDGEQVAPAGINLLGRPEGDKRSATESGADRLVLRNPRLAVNANRPRDLQIAEALLGAWGDTAEGQNP